MRQFFGKVNLSILLEKKSLKIFYLQRGLIWHLISFQRFTNQDGQGTIETDVHVSIVKNGIQDSNTVVALILASLEEYKKQNPSVTEVWLKTDNAAAYHW